MPGHLLRQFEEIEAAVGFARGKAAFVEVDAVGRGAKNVRGDALAVADERGGGEREHGGGMAHGTAGMRAAAGAHHVGVAHDDADAFDRHVQQVRDHLREAGLVALAGRLGADDDVDAAFRLDGDAGLLLGRADRGLDVVGQPKAEQLAALLGLAPPRRETVPVGNAHGEVHVFLVAAAVVGHADGVAVGHGFGPHQIAAAQADAVDAEFGRGNIDQALDGEGHFRAAGAAIGLRRNGVGEHRHRAQ